MSFFKTKCWCARCGGGYELWEHNESGEKTVHRVQHPSTWCKIVCMCRTPEEKKDADDAP